MKYTIYQLPLSDEGIFEPPNPNKTVKINRYVAVWRGEVEFIAGEETAALERLFEKFNIDHPDHYAGHSMSVSDIVHLGNDWFYCDDFGFEKVEVE